MKLLLDTHILMWTFAGDIRLPSKAIELINDNQNELLCSAAAIWEISLKHAHDPENFDLTAEKTIQYCNENGVFQLPLFFRHIPALNTLSRQENAPVHKDPFDRIMIAQAKTDQLLFITHDWLLRYYNEPCVFYV
jgi:PIN domain nuclease of toxin-antitoxin system